MHLHAQLGGDLIRSCDVYQELGIVLPEWVRRTAGFTRNVSDYASVRGIVRTRRWRDARISACRF